LSQAPIQVEILCSLSKSLRAGKYTGELGKPDKIVFVGHSFGSALSAAAVAGEPSAAVGLIMTGELETDILYIENVLNGLIGWSYNGSNVPGFVDASGFRIAVQQSHRFRGLDKVRNLETI
jgi:pimeloyl-ACP methyl ester carboxylesterase